MALHTEKLASIQKFEQNLKDLNEEIEASKQENDTEAQRELEADMDDMKSKVELLQDENHKLLSRKSMPIVEVARIEDKRSMRRVSIMSWVDVEIPKTAIDGSGVPTDISAVHPRILRISESSGAAVSPRFIGALPRWEEKQMEEEALSLPESEAEVEPTWSHPRGMEGPGSLSWREWAFGFPPSLYMTVCYLLGGHVGPSATLH